MLSVPLIVILGFSRVTNSLLTYSQEANVAIFDDTILSFDALYPANPHEYRYNPYILTN